MQEIINRIKSDLNNLKANYLAISFLICTIMFVDIVNLLVILVLSTWFLIIFLYFKDQFDFQKSKKYFTKKKGVK